MPSYTRFVPASVLALFASCAYPVGASSFLSRAQGEETTTIDSQMQSTIMNKIEEMLGTGGAVAESRLARIEDYLRVTFKAMPKNEDGKLEHAAVRYALHGYFVQRHGWYVRGLSDVGEGFEGSSSNVTLQDRVEEFVQGVFEQKLGAHGLSLREIALLAATFESLVQQEAGQRLDSAIAASGLTALQEFSVSEADDLVGAYMMSYILRIDYSTRPGALPLIRERIDKIYPAWPETEKFLQEVRAQQGHHKTLFTRSDVEDIVEQIGDQYGHFQDKECHNLKRSLLALEDMSIGTNGSGRVRMADFYGSALNDGNWQFVETTDALAQLGVLDAHDPKIPRVIIPNYINSPSNCLAGSKYYSVCCINECEDLLDSMEHRFQAPAVAPKDLMQAVASLPSSTVPANREMHPILVARLEEIAKHHGGRVPLHGRLFAQWMHHAYPRECPYPHLSGTVRSQSTSSPLETSVVKSADMSDIVEKHKAEHAESVVESMDECTAWSDSEELFVSVSHFGSDGSIRGSALLRPLVYLVVLASVASVLARQAASGSRIPGKAVGASAGKDFFV